MAGRMFIDITGQKFSRLTAIRMVGYDNFRSAVWLFKCDCGNETTIRSSCVRRGYTKSCGCLFKEMLSATKKKHGMRHTRLYTIYTGMKSRCNNTHTSSYVFYGAKGITVCSEWESDSSSFFKWAMENGYTDELTIDRKDNSKGYCPDNCRWATFAEQQSNKGNNLLITINGETKTQSQWLESIGLKGDRNILNYYRFELGMSPQDAMVKVIRRVAAS